MSKSIQKIAQSKLSNQKWGDPFQPRKYFFESIKWLLERKGAGLALAPGLGKTLITLLTYLILRDRGESSKVLILAKRRIIRKTWPDEIRKWGLPIDFAVVHGSPSRKLKLLREEHDVYLMTYESLFWLYKQDPKIYRQFDTLVCDESSKIKSWSAKRSKLLRQHLPDFYRRYCLTGSLQPNDEMDLFNPTFILDFGARLGRFITAFRNKWFYPSGYEGHDWKLNEGSADEIANIISDVWLRFGDEELDLPPLTRNVIEIDLSPRAMSMYNELESEFMLELDAGMLVAPNSGVASGKLRQMTGGAIYTRPRIPGERRYARPWEEVDTEKLDELEELLDDLQGKPLLIAYEFDHERQRIQKRFPWLKAIGGGTNDTDADNYIDQWNAGELPALLGQPDSIAHGLNLQGPLANVCFYSEGWNFENHDQFIRRVWRQGQKGHVIVYYLVARDTVDEEVVASNDLKGSKQDKLYAALRERFKNRKKGPKTMANVTQTGAKKATAKKPAAKRKAAPKKPAAKKAAAAKKNRTRLSNDARVLRGPTTPREGTAGERIVKACNRKGRTMAFGDLLKAYAEAAGDGRTAKTVRDPVMRAIKAGYLTVA